MDETIDKVLAEHVTQMQRLLDTHAADLGRLAARAVEAFDAGGRLLVAGSGPLAVQAQFLVQHFAYRLSLNRPVLPAIALGHDLALAAALARQGEQAQLLVRQLQCLGAGSQDVLLLLADNGYDEALKALLISAQEAGCVTAALVQGAPEEHFPASPDLVLRVDTTSPARFAELALFVGNLLCELVEAELFGI